MPCPPHGLSAVPLGRASGLWAESARMLTRERDDRLDIGDRVCRVRDVPSARQRQRPRHAEAPLRACCARPARTVGGLWSPSVRSAGRENPLNPIARSKPSCLGVARLVEERRRVLDHPLLNIGRQRVSRRRVRAPRSRRTARRHRRESPEAIRSTTASDPSAALPRAVAPDRDRRRAARKWRLVRDEAAEQCGTLAGQPQRDRSAERVRDHPRRRERQVLEQALRGRRRPHARCPVRLGRSLWLCPRRS